MQQQRCTTQTHDYSHSSDTAAMLAYKLEHTRLTDAKVEAIPAFIKAYLDSVTGDFSIANPGEDWRSGCTSNTAIYIGEKGEKMIRNEELPSKQLIYFGLGKDCATLSYYTGGIVKSAHLLVLEFKGNKVTSFWKRQTPDLTTKAAIIDYLKFMS